MGWWASLPVSSTCNASMGGGPLVPFPPSSQLLCPACCRKAPTAMEATAQRRPLGSALPTGPTAGAWGVHAASRVAVGQGGCTAAMRGCTARQQQLGLRLLSRMGRGRPLPPASLAIQMWGRSSSGLAATPCQRHGRLWGRAPEPRARNPLTHCRLWAGVRGADGTERSGE